MDISVDRAALPILPHRAYRRPRAITTRSVAASLALAAAVEALVVAFLGDLAAVFTRVSAELLPGGARSAARPFLGIDLRPLEIELQPLDYRALLVWFLASAAAAAVLAEVKRIGAPARYMAIYNLVMFAVSATYMLFTGELGYGAESFSDLYIRSAVVIWLVIPVFVGAISLFLPFTILERGLLVGASLAYNLVFSAVRYALFAWILSWSGAVTMASLYLFFGPLLDFVYVVGVFSVFLVPMSKRLGREGSQDVWTWL